VGLQRYRPGHPPPNPGLRGRRSEPRWEEGASAHRPSSDYARARHCAIPPRRAQVQCAGLAARQVRILASHPSVADLRPGSWPSQGRRFCAPASQRRLLFICYARRDVFHLVLPCLSACHKPHWWMRSTAVILRVQIWWKSCANLWFLIR